MKKAKSAAERPSVQAYTAELVRGRGNKQVVHYRVEVVGKCLQDFTTRQRALQVVKRALASGGWSVQKG